MRQIFQSIAQRRDKINISQKSSGNHLIYGISDGYESGINYTEWRFRTYVPRITANYHEVWINQWKDRYFLERSYLHLFNSNNEKFEEVEYILLHCDACEPDDTPHSIYKQSPHIHVKAAEEPIPKAHFALYNGRLHEILQNLKSYNMALAESVQLIDSQILKLQ